MSIEATQPGIHTKIQPEFCNVRGNDFICGDHAKAYAHMHIGVDIERRMCLKIQSVLQLQYSKGARCWCRTDCSS